MRVHIFNKVEIMNLKEWGAHGRSWRGWERNDTNSVPIKFSKIKKKVYLQATSGRWRCWTGKRLLALTQAKAGHSSSLLGFLQGSTFVSAGPPGRGLWGLAEQQFTCIWRPLNGACH